RHPGENGSEWFTGRLRNLLLQRARAVIVHAKCQKELLCSKWGTPKERIHVFPHGELGSIYEQIAKGMPVARDPNTVLFFGRVVTYKGIGVLLAAMNIVQQARPSAKLIIAGRGDDITRYFPAGLRTSGLEVIDRFIPHSEVVALFRRACIVVLPYLEASQSGVANLAMGLGTPVIASAIGGLAELICDGKDGMLVEPGDPKALAQAILRLMQDDALRNSLASAALTRCSRDLSWETIADQTIYLY